MKKKVPKKIPTKLLEKDAKFLFGLGLVELAEETGRLKLGEKIRNLNMAICPRCNTFILSSYRHDFVSCDCKKDTDQIFVDGGNDYHRYGGEGHILPK